MVKQRRAGTGKGANVLRYRIGASRATVRRQYAAYRAERGLPPRCDNGDCGFFEQPLVWNGKPLPLVLDHSNGVAADNCPENLRCLCPNCNAQLATHGGANRGKVRMAEGGFGRKRRDGNWDYVLPAETGVYSITGGDVEVRLDGGGK